MSAPNVLSELTAEMEKLERRIINGKCTSHEEYKAECSNFKTLVSCKDYIERALSGDRVEEWADEQD